MLQCSLADGIAVNVELALELFNKTEGKANRLVLFFDFKSHVVAVVFNHLHSSERFAHLTNTIVQIDEVVHFSFLVILVVDFEHTVSN